MTQQINWLEEVHNRKDDLIKDTQAFLQIKSVYDEGTISKHAPMGEGIAQALEFLLNKGENEGFEVKNVDGYAGHIEHGKGSELIGVLCHVDVVPEGEGWTTPPYAAEIRDGKIFARGAIDDKGPTMAAFYALKIIKELGLPLQRRVRMIIGTDEESSWKCVDHYFKHEEAPDMGFAPDADFPIICAEKGIANFFLKKQTNSPSIEKKGEEANSKIQLISFDSGQRVNMVPERATATLLIQNEEKVVEMLSEAFESYCTEQQVTGSVHVKGNQLTFTVEGISAHGAEPFKGVNAGLHLISFLSQYTYPREAQSFISLLQSYFVDDPYGEKLGIAIEDEMTGKLTLNVGVLEYRSETDSKIGLNLRYPVTTSYEAMMQRVEEIAKSFGYEVTDMDNLVPHHVDQNHALIKTLQKVYEEQTGEKATLLSTGGGTYARSLKTGVAFGPLFPGKEETAHQKDEYVEIDDLVRATAIYAQAIYELAIAPTTET